MTRIEEDEHRRPWGSHEQHHGESQDGQDGAAEDELVELDEEQTRRRLQELDAAERARSVEGRGCDGIAATDNLGRRHKQDSGLTGEQVLVRPDRRRPGPRR